eukprot:2486096-Rhodomonas_salina.1
MLRCEIKDKKPHFQRNFVPGMWFLVFDFGLYALRYPVLRQLLLSSCARAMQCPALAYRTRWTQQAHPLSPYALAMRCPVLIWLSLSSYADPTRCPECGFLYWISGGVRYRYAMSGTDRAYAYALATRCP